MPRKATQKNVVRELREKFLGSTRRRMTQRLFAKILGINPGTLKRIENNTLDLSRKIALRIQAEAGVNVEKLLDGKLRDVFGRGYKPDFYREWKERHFRQNEDIAKARAKALGWWIEILLRASVVGSKRRLWQVLRALIEAVDDCCSDFDLEGAVESILAGYMPKVKWNPAGLTSPELAAIREEQRRDESRNPSKDFRYRALFQVPPKPLQEPTRQEVEAFARKMYFKKQQWKRSSSRRRPA